MIDLLLVLPSHQENKPTLTLVTLQKYLQYKGFRVEIIKHLDTNDDIISYIQEYNPRFIGVSIPFSFYAPSGHELIRIIKKHFDIPVIVGGTHIILCPNEFRNVDYICKGYGEQFLLDLLSDKKPVDGLDIDDLPTMYTPESFTVLPNGDKAMLYLSSRGCVFNCYFCSIKKISGNTVHFRTVDKVIDDLKYFNSKGIDCINFSDETFTLNHNRTINLCKKIIENNIKIKYWCQTRVNLVDDDLIYLMKKSGCIGVSFGIETADPVILKESCKGIEIDDVTKAIKICNDNGLKCYGGFILGHPHDTLRSIDETLDYACFSGLDYASFSNMTPYPETLVREIALKEGGIQTDNWEFYHYGKDFVVYIPPSLKDFDLSKFKLYCNGKFMRSNISRFIDNLRRSVNQAGWKPKANFIRKLFYSFSRKYKPKIGIEFNENM